jgi:regulator of RNase E activity RraA
MLATVKTVKKMIRPACLISIALLSYSTVNAQVFSFTRDEMIKYTANNPYDRFPDGRPKVPDSVLEKVKGLTSEEIWTILPKRGYDNQFEAGWQLLHPDKKLVGRAVTVQYMPLRPDVGNVADANAVAKGETKNPPERVIDMLQPGDVVVVDMFGKVTYGTFGGDNLHTAIYAQTKTGFVIDGAIRDLDGLIEIGSAGYYRGATPTSYRGVMITGINVPIRIGNATVMPGDVVFGDREGVYFVPPALLKEVLDQAEITHIHDEWTKAILSTGKYKSSQVYPSPTDPELKKQYEEYLKKRLGK